MTAAALGHVAGFPGLGLLRRLRPVPDRSAVGAPSPSIHAGSAVAGEIRNGSRVHCGSLDEGGARLCPSGIATSTPQTFLVASRAAFVYPPRSSPARHERAGAHRVRPRSTRFEPVSLWKDVTTPVPRVLLSIPLAGPAPSGGTDTSRLCQGRSHPPRHHPGRAALSSADLLRQDNGEGLSPPLEPTAPHGANGKWVRATFTALARRS
jgi:hypothetical protein